MMYVSRPWCKDKRKIDESQGESEVRSKKAKGKSKKGRYRNVGL